MRFFTQAPSLIVLMASSTHAAAPISCQDLCDGLSECANDPGYHGSYCKDWQTIPVCFGMYTRLDGSLCFQPNDPTCDDLVLPPVTCSSVAVTTEAQTDVPTDAPTDVPPNGE